MTRIEAARARYQRAIANRDMGLGTKADVDAAKAACCALVFEREIGGYWNVAGDYGAQRAACISGASNLADDDGGDTSCE